jgi:small subunit ribosomal protein S17e
VVFGYSTAVFQRRSRVWFKNVGLECLVCMGRVRQTYIKRLAKDLVEADPERFSDDFEENKEELKEMDEFDSKRLRNRTAGYIVRVVQNKDKQPTAPA